MSWYMLGMIDSTRRTGAAGWRPCPPAAPSAAAAQAATGSPYAIECRAADPDLTTTQNASLSLGTSETASSMSARTGVVPRVPMIVALVMRAPSQCDTLMTSWLETPGKRYLLPPEKPTTSCGNTGP